MECIGAACIPISAFSLSLGSCCHFREEIQSNCRHLLGLSERFSVTDMFDTQCLQNFSAVLFMLFKINLKKTPSKTPLLLTTRDFINNKKKQKAFTNQSSKCVTEHLGRTEIQTSAFQC